MIDMDPDESTFLRVVREGCCWIHFEGRLCRRSRCCYQRGRLRSGVCPPPLSMVLFRTVAQQVTTLPAFSWRRDHGLSRREQQLVELLTERLTNKEIAARLNLAEQTVKNHVHSILRKVGAG